jgi:hypothetical protein
MWPSRFFSSMNSIAASTSSIVAASGRLPCIRRTMLADSRASESIVTLPLYFGSKNCSIDVMSPPVCLES